MFCLIQQNLSSNNKIFPNVFNIHACDGGYTNAGIIGEIVPNVFDNTEINGLILHKTRPLNRKKIAPVLFLLLKIV